MNKNELRQAMRNLSEVVRKGSATEVKTLSSPVTGAPLQINFTRGDILSVNVYEVGGDFSICIDGLEKIPQWVDDLGDQFVTKPQG